MCGGRSGATCGEAHGEVRHERSHPEHSGCPEAEASLLPPAAADFLSGTPIRTERPDYRQPPRKRGKRRRGWASFKNKTPKALARRRTPTHAGAKGGRLGVQ